jgi:hypothetical protein
LSGSVASLDGGLKDNVESMSYVSSVSVFSLEFSPNLRP